MKTPFIISEYKVQVQEQLQARFSRAHACMRQSNVRDFTEKKGGRMERLYLFVMELHESSPRDTDKRPKALQSIQPKLRRKHA